MCTAPVPKLVSKVKFFDGGQELKVKPGLRKGKKPVAQQDSWGEEGWVGRTYHESGCSPGIGA